MGNDKQEQLRQLPSIDRLVASSELESWNGTFKQSIRVKLAQQLVETVRESILSGKRCPSQPELIQQLDSSFRALLNRRITRVINATGIALHTNLGRAPLGKDSLSEMAEALWGYSTLEFDLNTGERGSRTDFVEQLIALLCDVESAIVVNNNAAATYLILYCFARGKEVLISRGELVQIGGGFRVPEILEVSGAKLAEVGATNMTSLSDYEKGINDQTGMILKVHQSNFLMSGHTKAPSLNDLVALGEKHNVLLGMDLGSGCLRKQQLDSHELTVSEVVRSGTPLTCFSADKLLGGPQAGIIVGSKALVSQIKKSPLYRALRLGKTELFLLECALLQYAKGDVPPVWNMLEQSHATLKLRCNRIKAQLQNLVQGVELTEGFSAVGGGTMPGCQIPTPLIELTAERPERLVRRLRDPNSSLAPVIVRVEKKRVLIDMRTVFESEEEQLVQKVKEALG